MHEKLQSKKETHFKQYLSIPLDRKNQDCVHRIHFAHHCSSKSV